MFLDQVSEINPTMAASQTFDSLLKQVQACNLNFRIELSPFSAVITLKKTLIKDKTGQLVFPPISEADLLKEAKFNENQLIQKIVNLDNVVNSLRNDHEKTLVECNMLSNIVSKLKSDIAIKDEIVNEREQKTKKERLKATKLVKTLRFENSKLNDEKGLLEKGAKHLENSVKIADEEVIECRLKFIKEKETLESKFDAEIKKVKRVFAEERNMNMKLLKKIEEIPPACYTEQKSFSSNQIQTDFHHEIPHCNEIPLPPIFSSQLCRKTPALKFLSSSIPNLNSICWTSTQEHDEDTNDAEEALNEQYDEEIADFILKNLHMPSHLGRGTSRTTSCSCWPSPTRPDE